MRTYPRSGLKLLFVPGEHLNVPSFRVFVPGEHPSKPPFWKGKPPFTIVHANITDRKKYWAGGINFSKDYSIGILPGWHGMENGQKPEMEKKGNRNGKRPQAGQGQKWPKNAQKCFFFFSISGFWPFSMPCQPGRLPITA